MTRSEWVEKNRDALEKQYYELYALTVQECMNNMWDAFKTFETALVQMGILEAEEDEMANSN